jgi:hypothetical protein
MAFVKAARHKSKLRLALTGPSGSGKTWGALQIAKGIGGKIACIDTERGSASLYNHIVDFDVMDLSAPYTPEVYIAAIKEAEKAGYDILIIDSASHEWSGPGGVLELVDEVARSKFKGNSWSAWSDLTPRHRAFIDAMVQSNMHIIATGRSKTETAQTEGNNGKKSVVKLGMKTEQRDGFEYEFTVVLDIVHDGHFAVASKDRTNLFSGDAKAITIDTGIMLKEWLESGDEPPVPMLDDNRRKKLFATMGKDVTADDLKAALKAKYGFESTKDIPLAKFDEVLALIEDLKLAKQDQPPQ